MAYLKSFKNLDYSLENAKQRLIDLFVNRVILYDDHCEIYFNISNDKGKQLKLTEQPNIENEIEYDNKKQSKRKCSDCYHLAGQKNTKTNAISKTWCDRIDLLICIDSVISTYVKPHRLGFFMLIGRIT